jgi:RNA polymerase sigma factor (sigma-70 family)
MGLQIYYSKDADLIKGCQQQNRQAQKRLYEMYGSRLYAVCCRYIKDKMEAEDVLITAFTKILNRIDQYSGEGNFEGWMRKVVVNDSLSHLRKSKSMYLETDISEVDFEIDYQKLEDQLEAEDLLKMIDNLPAGYRVVFNLYAIEGYSHKEIGEQLGISENTSKSQLSRARATLQKYLMESEAWDKKTKNYEQSNRSII